MDLCKKADVCYALRAPPYGDLATVNLTVAVPAEWDDAFPGVPLATARARGAALQYSRSIIGFIYLSAKLFTYLQHMHCGLGGGRPRRIFSRCGWALALLGLRETACGEGGSEPARAELAFSLLAA